MKQTILISILLILTSCGNSNKKTNEKHTETDINKAESIEKINKAENLEENIETEKLKNNYYQKILDNEFNNAKFYTLTDTISADFDGDGNTDKAIFVKKDGTSGIIIKHGVTNNEIKIGFGKQFAHLTNFNWVEYWGLVKDSTSYNVIFDEIGIVGDTIIKLINPSIVVRKEEFGGGLITFINGEYQWVHQSD